MIGVIPAAITAFAFALTTFIGFPEDLPTLRMAYDHIRDAQFREHGWGYLTCEGSAVVPVDVLCTETNRQMIRFNDRLC